MKKVMFISILLISILFISSCELFVPGGRSPQFAQIYIPQEVRNPGGGCSDKAINRIDCSEIAPPYGGGCTIGIPEGYVTFVCGDNPEDESIPYCGVGMCTIPEFMCTYLEEETNCHCEGDEPPVPECGDGQINQDWEECDCGQNGCEPIELDYQTCGNLGHAGGILSCTNGCQFDESGCHDCFSDDCDEVCPSECVGLGIDPDCNCDSNNDCCGDGCLNPPDTDCTLGCQTNGLCDGVCPDGCTINDDPDCGCSMVSNDCCPDQCDGNNDIDCMTCDIVSAYWQQDTSEDTVVEGTVVTLNVIGEGYCDGFLLSDFRVFDEDYWTTDDLCCYLDGGYFTGNTFQRTWTSARCCVDEMGEVNPQFRFVAKLASDPSILEYSERLKVLEA